MANKNPFTPVFGCIPPYMAGRESMIRDMSSAFEQDSIDPNWCTVFVGARGTGKTALLSLLTREAQQRGWIAVGVSCEPGLLEEVVEQTVRAAAEFVEREDRVRLKSLSLGNVFGAEWEYRNPPTGTWRTRMTDLVSALNEQGVGVLITVDEVKGTVKDMIQLASVYQHFVREERRASLLMAGLPSHVSSLVSNDSTSFLRRAQTRKLGSVEDGEVRVALRRTIEEGGRTIDERALDAAIGPIDGFPYMMQLVGYHAWNMNAESERITCADVRDGVVLAQAEFKDSVLDATYRELTDGDVAFLAAMLPDDGKPTSLKSIAERSGKPRGTVRAYKARLVEQGIVADERRGYVVFELPGFCDYLKEKL